MRDRPAGQDEELQHVVEGGRVTLAFADDGEQLLEVFAKLVRVAQRFARSHPVDVSPKRIDLAVVGHVPIGVREGPGRKRVGRESLMNECEGRFECGVGQVWEHRLDLVGDQHALVDDRVGRQACDVEQAFLIERQPVDRSIDTLSNDIELSFEARVRVWMARERLATPDEELPDHRFTALGGFAQARVVGRDIAPSQDALALFGRDVRKEGPECGSARRDHAAGRPFPHRRRLVRGDACRVAQLPSGRSDVAAVARFRRRRQCWLRSRMLRDATD